MNAGAFHRLCREVAATSDHALMIGMIARATDGDPLSEQQAEMLADIIREQSESLIRVIRQEGTT